MLTTTWASNALILTGLFLSASCKTVQNRSATKSEDYIDFKDVPPITCAKGDPSYFLMVNLPEGSKIKIADVLARNPEVSAGNQDTTTLREGDYNRLDFCVADDSIELKQVLFGNKRIRTLRIFKIEEMATLEGVRETLFDGDYSKLKIVAPFSESGSDWMESFVVLGSSNPTGAIVGTTGFYQRGENKMKVLDFTQGSFEYVDFKPFDPNTNPTNYKECDGGVTEPKASARTGEEWPTARGRIQLGTMMMDFVSYYDPDPQDHTNPYTFLRLAYVCKFTLTDSSAKMGNQANIPRSFLRNDPKIQYSYPRTHHGWEDAMTIKINNVTYAINLIGGQYKFTYADGTSVEGTHDLMERQKNGEAL